MDSCNSFELDLCTRYCELLLLEYQYICKCIKFMIIVTGVNNSRNWIKYILFSLSSETIFTLNASCLISQRNYKNNFKIILIDSRVWNWKWEYPIM